MKTTNILLLAATVLSLGVVACGDDSETSTGTGGGSSSSGTDATTSTTTTGSPTSSSSGGDGGGPTSTGVGGEGGGTGGEGGQGGSGPPAVPELGPQLERMGRPAVNTATIDTFLSFDEEGGLLPSDDDVRSASEDDYNAAVNGSDDAAAFIPTMALQLTVLDALDGTCGNSLAWGLLTEEGQCPNSVDGEPIVCYGALATVLNADALWVKTEYESCGLYLGVEADGAGVIANPDCGGRRPVDDVIRTTYSAVSGFVNPADPQVFLFDDGITPPADLHPDTFPFLAAPYEE